MMKTLKALSESTKVSPVATKVARDAKTGQLVTVMGVGALKGDNLKIRKDVNLLKPTAKRALLQRTEKRKAGQAGC